MKRLLGLLVGAVLVSAPAAAQNVTRILVGFPPGGPVDTVARIVADQLGKELNQTIIIENRAGANASLAGAEVKKSAPDGKALWITSVGAAAINQWLMPNVPYVMETDFTPISVVVNNDELLVVQKAGPIKSVADLLAAAKAATDPLPWASTGNGSIPHLALEQFMQASGLSFNHVVYRGAAPAINDVAGGTITAFFGDVAGLMGNVGEAGLLRPIGIAAKKRHPVLPDVPTLEELGIKNIDTNNWYAFYAPAKLPAETQAALNKAVHAALKHPATAEKLRKLGAEPAPSTPEFLATLQKQDADKWGKLITARSIKVQ